MKDILTAYGNVCIGSKVELYEHFVHLIQKTVNDLNYPPGVALTGGSSPKDFFKWLVSNPEKLPQVREDIVFTVSDERYVPEDSEESNYGNALRMFFEPLGVNVDNRFPWDTTRIPNDAAGWYQKLWELSFGEDNTYDICMLGIGEDCHTASLFPKSPLLQSGSTQDQNFSFVEVPGKGERLTITPRGLSKCGQIVVFVVGKNKAEALKRVFSSEEHDVSEVPVALLKDFKEKVLWMVDEEASSLIEF